MLATEGKTYKQATRPVRELIRAVWDDIRRSSEEYQAVFEPPVVYELAQALTIELTMVGRLNAAPKASPQCRREMVNGCLYAVLHHVQRAHLEYLKILVFKIGEMIEARGLEEASESYLNFTRRALKCREHEFIGLGSDYDGTVACYRDLLDFTKRNHVLRQLYCDICRPDLSRIPPSDPTDKPFAASLHTMERVRKVLYYEVVLHTIRRQRFFRLVFWLVKSYGQGVFEEQALTKFLAEIQIMTLMYILQKFDPLHEIRARLERCAGWRSIRDSTTGDIDLTDPQIQHSLEESCDCALEYMFNG